jgi:hypothetical protein
MIGSPIQRDITFFFEETNLISYFPENRYLPIRHEVSITTNLMEVVLELRKGLPKEFQGIKWDVEIPTDTVLIQFVGISGQLRDSTSPKYELNQDGSIKFLNLYAEIGRGWTLEEIDSLTSEKLIDFNGFDVVVRYPQGLGAAGGFQPIIEWLLNFGIDFVAANMLQHLLSKGFKFLKLKKQKSLTVRVAQNWESNNLCYPEQLRVLLDTRPTWNVDELATFLQIQSFTAAKLLKALGFLKYKEKTYVLSNKRKAIKRRQKWLIAERNYFQTK